MKINKKIQKGVLKKKKIKAVKEYPEYMRWKIQTRGVRPTALPPAYCHSSFGGVCARTGLGGALGKSSISSPVEMFHSWINIMCIY